MEARDAAQTLVRRRLGGTTSGRWRALFAALTGAAVVATGLVALPPATASALPSSFPADAGVYLVSRTDDGASTQAAMTPDGQKVAYVSTARDLARGARDDTANVYLAEAVAGSGDPFSGSPMLVSRPDASLGAEPADGLSYGPALSADGRMVAFVSRATNLVAAGGTTDRASVYVRDTVRGTTVRLDAGVEPDGESTEPDISDDGRYVVFTSEATNLVAGVGAAGAGVFVADLDADGDGTRGDLALTRLPAPPGVTGGMSQPAISGNGAWVVFTGWTGGGAADPGATSAVYRSDRAGGNSVRLFDRAHGGAVDAVGNAFAAVVDGCDGGPVVAAATLDANGVVLAVGLGSADVVRGVGEVQSPVISANGSTVAWSSTQPSPGDAAELAEPVVRVAEPAWRDAAPSDACTEPGVGAGTAELGAGEASGISASGRTVIFSGPSDMTSAERSVTAVDRRTNDGLSVTNTLGTLAAPGRITGVATDDVPVAALAESASELAQTPVSRLLSGDAPLTRLPLRTLLPALGEPPAEPARGEDQATPVLRGATIADLPVRSADDPGGWTELLARTDFADRSADTVTLAEVLTWAEQAASDATGGDEAEAARRIRALTLADIADATALDALPLSSVAVGAARLDESPREEAGLDDTELVSLIDPASLPWQLLDPGAIPGTVDVQQTEAPDCADGCPAAVRFQFTFDPGPAGPASFTAPTAAIELPAATEPESVRVGGSGPGYAGATDASYRGSLQIDGSLVRLPLADTPAGTVRSVTVGYSASREPSAAPSRAVLTSGARTARDEIPVAAPEARDADPDAAADAPADAETLPAGIVRYESISPAPVEPDAEARPVVGAADDEDWYAVAPPEPGERLMVTADAGGDADSGGRVAVAVFGPAASVTPLGVPVSGELPGAPLPEAGPGPEPGVVGLALVAHGTTGRDGTVAVEAPSSEIEGSGAWLVRVRSADGQTSGGLYALRATYEREREDQRCAPWAPPAGVDPAPSPISPLSPLSPIDPIDPLDPLAPPPLAPTDPLGVDPLLTDPLAPIAPPPIASDPVTDATNTVFVVDTSRFRAIHGFDAAEEVIAAIRALDGSGSVSGDAVAGAILSVDSDPAVAAARTALDAQPCSVSGRRALAAAITGYVTRAIGAERDHIASIVIVGGDDVIPFAPVPQRADRFVEAGHADALRRAEQADGTACPATVAADAIDPCATPLSSAAAANQILTDDPYGLADAYRTVGGYVYVPSVAVGRLVDGADQIRGQLDRFRLADGLLDGDSAVSAGHGAWSELPQVVSETLAWRLGSGDVELAEPWTTADVEALLFSAGTPAPRLIALGVQGDERRLLPGADDAVAGGLSAELWEADDHEPPTVPSADAPFDPNAAVDSLDGSIVFLLGGHAGTHLPGTVYGDATDWADVFSPAGALIAHSGYGLADPMTTALSERLFRLYAEGIGVQGSDGPVSAGSALMFAKQAYLGRAAMSTGYDEKALLQTVYYGLPMYAFADSTKQPTSGPPPELAPAEAGAGPASAPVSLAPSFATITRSDASGGQVTYVAADGELPLAAAGRPLLPQVVTPIPSTDGAGGVPRGALITGLTSTWSDSIRPAVAVPTTGTVLDAAPADGIAFPSTFTAIGRERTPGGLHSTLVTTPASVQTAAGGEGRVELFPAMELEVLYGSSEDTVAPVIRSTAASADRVVVHADDAGSGSISRALLLIQEAAAPAAGTERPWQAIDLALDADGAWAADIPADLASTGYRWIVQVADAAGNVAVDTAQGRIGVVPAEAPQFGADDDATEGDAHPAELTVTAGEPVRRTLSVTAAPGAQVTGVYRLLARDDERGEAVPGEDEGAAHAPAVRGTGALAVEPAGEGEMRAELDAVVETPGRYTVELSVCSGSLCGDAVEFGLTVLPSNTAPTATVALDGDASASGVVTATAAGADADGDSVALTYRWSRNGVPIRGADDPTLDLSGVVASGDVLTVVVTPHDGSTAGHAASASILVRADPDRRPSPDR
ncbi:hypothetical protein ACFUTX_11470 [Microbacterium sp. NPDC057407]|uniref:hypothetical protein n=1 Tax=Microbacterium sp. NPDC057407 TaxID=3346120 RepID=UPI00367170A8